MITSKYIIRRAIDISQDNEIAQFEKNYFKPISNTSAISIEGKGISTEDKIKLFYNVLNTFFKSKEYVNFIICIPGASDNRIVNYIGGWGILKKNGVLIDDVDCKKEYKIKINGKINFFLEGGCEC